MSRTKLSPAEERQALNWGIKIVPMFDSAQQFGDIEFVSGPNGRDLALVQGVDNLHQQITSVLVTALGADPLNINHGFAGFEVIANERNPILRREQVRFAVQGVLQGDPRVVQVLRVLIGNEIELFRQGEITAVAPDQASATPGDRYTTTEIEAHFTISSGETLRLAVGPVSGATS